MPQKSIPTARFHLSAASPLTIPINAAVTIVTCSRPPPATGKERGGERLTRGMDFRVDLVKLDAHRRRRRIADSDLAGYDDEIASTREKVILDLQTAADEMKHAIFKDGHRLRKLRTRRADLDTPPSFSDIDGGGCAGDENGSADGKGKSNIGESQMKAGLAAAIEKPMKLRSGGAAAASVGKKERPKFSVALLKIEIEEDFYSMAGRRPPRRPKKRAMNVQRQKHYFRDYGYLKLRLICIKCLKVNEGDIRCEF